MIMREGLRPEPCRVLTLSGEEGKGVPGKETEEEKLPGGSKRSQDENASKGRTSLVLLIR